MTEGPYYQRTTNNVFTFAEDCCDSNLLEEKTTDDKPEILTKVNDDGSTSNYFDKRKLKIAPRSTLQFKVGPPFQLTNVFGMVTDTNSGRQVFFKIYPRIDRGFDSIGDEWVGYKRNYFTLVSSFEVQDYSLDDFLNSSFQLSISQQLFCGQTVPVKYFAMLIRAKTDDSERARIKLVQHTAKRDKGPQFEPQVCPLIPSQLPRHQIIREASNVRNESKMKRYESTFFFHRDSTDRYFSNDAIIRSYPNDCIQKVARYERVQFAASISTKKPGQVNKYFKLHVVLGAVVDRNNISEGFVENLPNEEFILPDGETGVFFDLQEMETPPLVIRGRSPSNYTGLQHYSYSVTRNFTTAINATATTTSTVNENMGKALVDISSNSCMEENLKDEEGNRRKKGKPGRPAKRNAKVVRVNGRQRKQSKNGKENVCDEDERNNEQEMENQQQNALTCEGEIQTLEQIQHIILTQLPLYTEQLDRQAQGQSDSLPVFKPHSLDTMEPASIGLKDIELRPSLRGFMKQKQGAECNFDTLPLPLPLPLPLISISPNYSEVKDIETTTIDYGKYYRPQSSNYDTSNDSLWRKLRPMEETYLNEYGKNNYGDDGCDNENKGNNSYNRYGIWEDGEMEAEQMSMENISFMFYDNTRRIASGVSEEEFNMLSTAGREEQTVEQFSQLAYNTIGEQFDYHASRCMLSTSGSSWES